MVTRNRKRRFFIISLGCAKNTVDAQGMATLLEQAGYRKVGKPERADLLFVNTCGFIQPAREESLAALQELARSKRSGQMLIAAGCWAQRDAGAILAAVPAVDGLFGVRRWMDVVEVVRQLEQAGPSRPLIYAPDLPTTEQDPQGVPRVAVQGASAYLKIADGCSRRCAFCAIPLIKGPAVSRPVERILEEAALLAAQGVKEIILIAQDTTAYGRDLGLEDGLAMLLERLVEQAPGVPWIRVMYAFPGAVTSRLVEVMTSHPQVLPYLDIPLQHAHPAILKRMRRPTDVGWVRRMVTRLRRCLPGIAIRSTFIVGYPGETEEEFATLLEFVQEMALDRVGVFTYSHEAGTAAASLTDDVPYQLKQERRARLMAVQQPISLAKNRALVGQVLDVLIEGRREPGAHRREPPLSVGRSYRDAPEIDGLVLVQGDAPVGQLVKVRVTAALEYDLIGQPAS